MWSSTRTSSPLNWITYPVWNACQRLCVYVYVLCKFLLQFILYINVPSATSRGFGWRILCIVEVTALSTNKQHSLSLCIYRLWSYMYYAILFWRKHIKTKCLRNRVPRSWFGLMLWFNISFEEKRKIQRQRRINPLYSRCCHWRTSDELGVYHNVVGIFVVF